MEEQRFALRPRFGIAWRLLNRDRVWSWRFNRIARRVWLRFARLVRLFGWLGIVDGWLHSQSHQTSGIVTAVTNDQKVPWFPRNTLAQLRLPIMPPF